MNLTVKMFALLALLLFSATVLQGCATPADGVSSMPWSRPESWETQGRLSPGVNF